MTRHPSIADTDALADRYHTATGKTYGDRPYIYHPRQVADLVTVYGDDAVRAALLHDTVEDTAYTLDQMRADGYSDLTVTTVDAVTRRAGETYMEFIRRCSHHPLGRIIKLADNRHNSSTLDQAEDQLWAAGMRRRYERARLILERALVHDTANLDGFADIGGIRVADLDNSEGPYLWIAIGHHPHDAVRLACEERARQLGMPNLTGDEHPPYRLDIESGWAIWTGDRKQWTVTTVGPDKHGHYRPITSDTVGAFRATWIENPT